MWVDTESGYELMIQDYDAYDVGSEVMLYIDPDDIQVMRKERVSNVLEGKMVDETHVEMIDGVFECLPHEGIGAGDRVRAEVGFEQVDLLDHQEEGEVAGEVHFMIYKGDHYHLTILTDAGYHLWVDTDDIWDKGDLVGVNIAPESIKLTKCDD
jgi:spermidine/putrescine transport system ATP-binding protein